MNENYPFLLMVDFSTLGINRRNLHILCKFIIISIFNAMGIDINYYNTYILVQSCVKSIVFDSPNCIQYPVKFGSEGSWNIIELSIVGNGN